MKEAAVSLLLVLCFLQICLAQPNPSCNNKAQPCSCDNTNDTPAATFYSNCPQPTNYAPEGQDIIFNFPTDLYKNIGGTFYTKSYGYTVTAFQWLVRGNTYEFSTCDRANAANTVSGFDTVLVLRSPSGEFLASNDDCSLRGEPLGKCSLLTYYHNSPDFGTVYLSVYKKTIDHSGINPYVCGAESSAQKIYTSIYADIVKLGNRGTIDCDFSLTCRDTVEQKGYTIDIEDFLGRDADICDVHFYDIDFSIDGVVQEDDSEFRCLDGNHTVTLSVYGQSCSSKLEMIPYVPSGGQCEYTKIFPNFFVSHCTFGKYCSIDPTRYLPDFSFDFETEEENEGRAVRYNCYRDQDFKYEVGGFTDAFVHFGDVEENIEMTVTFPPGNQESYECPGTSYSGIQPLSLYKFNGEIQPPSKINYIWDGDLIFYDTVYRLEYFQAIDFYSGGCGKRQVTDSFSPSLYLYDPSGFYNLNNDNEVYEKVEFQYNSASDDGCFPSGTCRYMETCTTTVDFCIPNPSNDNKVNSFQNSEVVKLVLVSINQDTVGTSDNFFTQHFVSLGNPQVILTNDPNPDYYYSSPGCVDFNSIVGPPGPPGDGPVRIPIPPGGDGNLTGAK